MDNISKVCMSLFDQLGNEMRLVLYIQTGIIKELEMLICFGVASFSIEKDIFVFIHLCADIVE